MTDSITQELERASLGSSTQSPANYAQPQQPSVGVKKDNITRELEQASLGGASQSAPAPQPAPVQPVQAPQAAQPQGVQEANPSVKPVDVNGNPTLMGGLYNYVSDYHNGIPWMLVNAGKGLAKGLYQTGKKIYHKVDETFEKHPLLNRALNTNISPMSLTSPLNLATNFARLSGNAVPNPIAQATNAVAKPTTDYVNMHPEVKRAIENAIAKVDTKLSNKSNGAMQGVGSFLGQTTPYLMIPVGEDARLAQGIYRTARGMGVSKLASRTAASSIKNFASMGKQGLTFGAAKNGLDVVNKKKTIGEAVKDTGKEGLGWGLTGLVGGAATQVAKPAAKTFIGKPLDKVLGKIADKSGVGGSTTRVLGKIYHATGAKSDNEIIQASAKRAQQEYEYRQALRRIKSATQSDTDKLREYGGMSDLNQKQVKENLQLGSAKAKNREIDRVNSILDEREKAGQGVEEIENDLGNLNEEAFEQKYTFTKDGYRAAKDNQYYKRETEPTDFDEVFSNMNGAQKRAFNDLKDPEVFQTAADHMDSDMFRENYGMTKEQAYEYYTTKNTFEPHVDKDAKQQTKEEQTTQEENFAKADEEGRNPFDENDNETKTTSKKNTQQTEQTSDVNNTSEHAQDSGSPVNEQSGITSPKEEQTHVNEPANSSEANKPKEEQTVEQEQPKVEEPKKSKTDGMDLETLDVGTLSSLMDKGNYYLKKRYGITRKDVYQVLKRKRAEQAAKYAQKTEKTQEERWTKQYLSNLDHRTFIGKGKNRRVGVNNAVILDRQRAYDAMWDDIALSDMPEAEKVARIKALNNAVDEFHRRMNDFHATNHYPSKTPEIISKRDYYPSKPKAKTESSPKPEAKAEVGQSKTETQVEQPKTETKVEQIKTEPKVEQPKETPAKPEAKEEPSKPVAEEKPTEEQPKEEKKPEVRKRLWTYKPSNLNNKELEAEIKRLKETPNRSDAQNQRLYKCNQEKAKRDYHLTKTPEITKLPEGKAEGASEAMGEKGWGKNWEEQKTPTTSNEEAVYNEAPKSEYAKDAEFDNEGNSASVVDTSTPLTRYSPLRDDATQHEKDLYHKFQKAWEALDKKSDNPYEARNAVKELTDSIETEEDKTLVNKWLMNQGAKDADFVARARERGENPAFDDKENDVAKIVKQINNYKYGHDANVPSAKTKKKTYINPTAVRNKHGLAAVKKLSDLLQTTKVIKQRIPNYEVGTKEYKKLVAQLEHTKNQIRKVLDNVKKYNQTAKLHNKPQINLKINKERIKEILKDDTSSEIKKQYYNTQGQNSKPAKSGNATNNNPIDINSARDVINGKKADASLVGKKTTVGELTGDANSPNANIEVHFTDKGDASFICDTNGIAKRIEINAVKGIDNVAFKHELGHFNFRTFVETHNDPIYRRILDECQKANEAFLVVQDEFNDLLNKVIDGVATPEECARYLKLRDNEWKTYKLDLEECIATADAKGYLNINNKSEVDKFIDTFNNVKDTLFDKNNIIGIGDTIDGFIKKTGWAKTTKNNKNVGATGGTHNTGSVKNRTSGHGKNSKSIQQQTQSVQGTYSKGVSKGSSSKSGNDVRLNYIDTPTKDKYPNLFNKKVQSQAKFRREMNKASEDTKLRYDIITKKEAKARIAKQHGEGDAVYMHEGWKSKSGAIEDNMPPKSEKVGLFGHKTRDGLYVKDAQKGMAQDIEEFYRLDKIDDTVKMLKQFNAPSKALRNDYVGVNENILANCLYGGKSKEFFDLLNNTASKTPVKGMTEEQAVVAKIRQAMQDNKANAEYWVQKVKDNIEPTMYVPKKLLNETIETFDKSTLKDYMDITKHIGESRFGGRAGRAFVKGLGVTMDIANSQFKKGVLATTTFFTNNRISDATMLASAAKNTKQGLRAFKTAVDLRKLEAKGTKLPDELGQSYTKDVLKDPNATMPRTGYKKIDDILSLFDGHHYKEWTNVFKLSGNTFIGIPSKIYTKISEKMMNFNEHFDKFDRRMAFGIALDNHSKAIIKNMGQKMVTLKEMMAYVNKNPELEKQLIKETNDILGDYSKFSKKEKSVAKRVLPFYSWFRTVSRYQLALLKKDPGKFIIFNQMKYDMSHDDTEDKKDWQKGSVDTNLRDKRNGQKLIINKAKQIGMGFDFVGTAKTFGQKGVKAGTKHIADQAYDVVNDIASGINPLVKVPIEGVKGSKFGVSPEIQSKNWVPSNNWKTAKGKDTTYVNTSGSGETSKGLPWTERGKYILRQNEKYFYPWEFNSQAGTLYDNAKSLITTGHLGSRDKSYDTAHGGFRSGDKTKAIGRKGEPIERYAGNNVSERTKLTNILTGGSLQGKRKLNKEEEANRQKAIAEKRKEKYRKQTQRLKKNKRK